MSFARYVPYFVESDSDPTVLLAIDPAVSGDHVGWFDTVRDRLFRVVSSHESQGVLTFVTANATYELRPITLELYERYGTRQRSRGTAVLQHRAGAELLPGIPTLAS